MRVLIADSFESSGVEALRGAGFDVVHEPALGGDTLVAAVAEKAPDVLVVRSTKVPAEAIEAGPLKLIVRAGAGYNTIDVAAASKRGIYVSNCPGKNSIAVAELAFGHLCALDRRLADNDAALKAGQWRKGEFGKARGLHGRTLGLIGLGKIGTEMVSRARAFGMPVVAWSRSLTTERAEELGITRADSMLEVARASDAVSVHVALTPDTRGSLGEEFFEAMRPGAFFINTSRGEVVDNEALKAAIVAKGLKVGLDVFATEPAGSSGEFADDIVNLPGVHGTAHIGASTEQAQQAIADETVRIITTFATSGSVPNVVNLARKTPAVCTLVIRHLDRPGVLARILDAISEAGINVQEMANIVFDGAEAAVAQINLQTRPSDALLGAVRAIDAVLDAEIIDL
ncbi:MAG: 3-phosphoglycerate dehydrogenase family protein [Propionibacteriaceae bacterium]|nr:hydroxyacid dehydrogenase [Micropruina sp.]HBY22978.1 hydroxyacid dehydrogenase [Propionibacteriaceae bacterium]